MAAMMGGGHDGVRVRFQTDAFTGVVTMHCHYLLHEDMGMMGVMEIRGQEGAQYPGRLGRCYRSSTPGETWVPLPAPVDHALGGLKLAATSGGALLAAAAAIMVVGVNAASRAGVGMGGPIAALM
jgi:hypothetical protein